MPDIGPVQNNKAIKNIKKRFGPGCLHVSATHFSTVYFAVIFREALCMLR